MTAETQMPDAPLVAVLAAGLASRFGGGKLDACCAGRRLGAWALMRVAGAGLPSGIIVTGPQPPAFALEAPGWSVVANPAHAKGIGTSLALAAAEALRRGAPALLVLLADMPLIDAALLRRLAQARRPTAMRYPGGRPGVPALLPAPLLAPLRQLTGDRGAAALLQAALGLDLVEPPAGMLLDVDSAADLARAEALLKDNCGQAGLTNRVERP